MSEFQNNPSQFNDAEQAQMQKLAAFRKLATSILARHWLILLLCFFFTCIGVGGGFYWYATQKVKRSTASTQLIFYPKMTDRIKGVDTNQVMRIITHRTIFVAVANEMGIPPSGHSELSSDFEIIQDSRLQNCYTITAIAMTDEEAIQRVNSFADAAIVEYISYRMEDLNKWRESNERQRQDITVEMRRIDNEEQALNRQYGLTDISGELLRLSELVSRKRAELSVTAVDISHAEATVNHLKQQLGGANPDILNVADEIRKYSSRIDADNQEIEKLRRDYSDENPRLQVIINERNTLQKKYTAFLAQYGVTAINEKDLERLGDIGTKTKAQQLIISTLTAAKGVLEADLAKHEKRLKEIQEIAPKYDSIRLHRDEMIPKRRACDDMEVDIRYLEASARTELSQSERADRAFMEGRMNRKKIILIVGAGVVVTTLLAAVIVLAGILFGRIYDMEEVAMDPDVIPLTTAGGANDSGEELFYRFQQAMGDRKLALIVALQGARQDHAVLSEFETQCALGGVRVLFLEITDAKNFVEPENAVTFTAISYVAERGWMPVSNCSNLMASELAMLKADIQILASDFDLIFITRDRPFNTKGIAYEQLKQLCDATVLLIGPKKTPRRFLKKATENADKEKHPIMAIITSFKSLILITMCAMMLCGCYRPRYTDYFDLYPELDEDTTTATQVSGLSKEDIAKREKLLWDLEHESESVYRINAGDKLRLVVYNHSDFTADTTVTPDGNIGLVFLGQVHVAGLTLAEACKVIGDGLSQYIKNPSVGLTPLEIASETVTIGGAVTRPGMYLISNGMRLADLYAKAGGSSVRYFDMQQLDAADLLRSIIQRNGELLPVDFTKAIEKGEVPHNVRLRKGDYVYIGVRSESMVCLIGDVRQPIKRLVDGNLGLLELLASGGWLQETHWSHIIIIRGGVTNPRMYKVDVDAILAGLRPNVKLIPGDIVFVPHDSVSEYNVFVRKALPSGQLFNLITTPVSYWSTK